MIKAKDNDNLRQTKLQKNRIRKNSIANKWVVNLKYDSNVYPTPSSSSSSSLPADVVNKNKK